MCNSAFGAGSAFEIDRGTAIPSIQSNQATKFNSKADELCAIE